MAQPHLALAPAGGYLVDFSADERWLIQPNVEPFRTEGRLLAKTAARTWPQAQSRIPMRHESQVLREDLLELESLGMAWRMP